MEKPIQLKALVRTSAATMLKNNDFGRDISTHSLITTGKSETSGSNFRRLSISFSQERIWFQVGMLWDAKAIKGKK